MTITAQLDISIEPNMYMFPASFAQQRLWFLDQLEPNSSAYNILSTLHINGLLDVEILKRSLQAIIERHEALRTTFAISDGQPMQVIVPTLNVPLSLVNLEHLPEEEREAEALRLANDEVKVPFDLDLAGGSLLRTTLLKLGSQEHILLLCIHHIIFDGWSNSVFFQELETLYHVLSSGQSGVLPELPIQYADFTLWQRGWLQGELLEEHLAYWKQQLADAPTLLELPTDHQRPSVPTKRGATHLFTLPFSLTKALKGLSRRHRVSLFMTLTAAFHTLLYRYSGQEDLLMGTVAADRRLPETEKMIGFFVNTLVLRADLSGDPTFQELLRRVREQVLQALDHQDVPFEYLVKELQPDRSLGQNPFFQVMLVLDPPDADLQPDWILNQMDIKTDTAKFDLDLILRDLPEGLQGRLTYCTDLFEEATIRHMIGHWRTVLEGIVAHPEQHLSELPLLTAEERHQLLVDWNATAIPYPKDQTVYQLVEEQVERTPDSVAVIFENQQMTYRELDTRANQLAHRLRQLGVGPDVCVGVCMDRSPELIVSLLGILKAGGAYIPLDPAYPRERLTFMLQDTKTSVLLTQEKFIGMLPAEGAHLMCLDGGWSAIAQESTEKLESVATAESLAYVMYTSGSTGRPKGVEIRHRSIIRLLFGVDYTRLDATRTILHMAPISFDAATFEVWGALLYGARCVLFPERIPTPRAIGRAIRKHHVTTIWLTTALFNAIIDEAPEALLGTKHILTGGEVVSITHMRRAIAALPTAQFSNCYGPTESTTFATCYPIPTQLSETLRSVPIGRPIGNTRVYILDRSGNPVPIGVPGELHIAGDGLARGYFNRPDLTAEKFVTDPFNSKPDAKLYRTGDIVRYLLDGNIEFLGRVDHQIKIRGFRIEPGEIETVLSQHPWVREALIVVRENGSSGKRLVAYVFPLGKQQVTVHELRSFLKERLPEYMIPSDFVLLDSMPVTPNGKVDWRALPEPEQGSQRVEGNVGGMLLAVHHLLKQIWEDLLGVQAISMQDNFFDLGGHSLLAARLIDRIEQATGKKLPLSTLYARATIEHLADVLLEQTEINKQGKSNSRAVVIAIRASGSRRPFFFLHGDWIGGGFYSLSLVRSLGPDQPFYALEPYKFDGMAIPPTMEEMAAAHIEAMRAIQPEGPYLLGGFCNGGLIALEMARQLHAEDQEVGLLVLIEPATVAPHRLIRGAITRIGNFLRFSPNKQFDQFLRLDWFLLYLHLLFLNCRSKLGLTKRDQTDNPIKLGSRRGKKGASNPILASPLPSIESLRQDWPSIYRWVASGYTHKHYPGKVTLFWSSESYPRRGEWHRDGKIDEVETHVIPGTHKTCRTQYLDALAECLRMVLSK
jgi:amino acid adenylation domain-containing protein